MTAIFLVVTTLLLAALVFGRISFLERRAMVQEAVDAITGELADELALADDMFDPRDPAKRPLWNVEWMWTRRTARHVHTLALRVSLDEKERARRGIGCLPPRHIVKTVLFEFDAREPGNVIRAEAKRTAIFYHQAFVDYLWGRAYTLPRGLERLMGYESQGK